MGAIGFLQHHAGAGVTISALGARLPVRFLVLAAFDGPRGDSGKADDGNRAIPGCTCPIAKGRQFDMT